MPLLSELIRAVEAKLGNDGRVLVRWSGTEPKLRLMVEGPDPAVLQALVSEMAEAARRDLATAG
jgi:phosphoglucosamine mutase